VLFYTVIHFFKEVIQDMNIREKLNEEDILAQDIYKS